MSVCIGTTSFAYGVYTSNLHSFSYALQQLNIFGMISGNLISKLAITSSLHSNSYKNIDRFVFEILTNPLVNSSNRILPAGTVLLRILYFHGGERNGTSSFATVFVNETHQRSEVLGHHFLNIQMQAILVQTSEIILRRISSLFLPPHSSDEMHTPQQHTDSC